MFSGKTAWFSSSCVANASQMWVQNGGKLDDIEMAQFIISDDWEHEDTKDLLNSEAYLKQHLAVFKSQYVLDAVDSGIKNVVLGKYFLIPKAIEDSIHLKNSSHIPRRQGASTTQRSDISSKHVTPDTVMNDRRHQSSNLPRPHSSSVKTYSPSTFRRTNQRSKVYQQASASKERDSSPHIKSLPKILGCLNSVKLGEENTHLQVFYLTDTQ